MRYFYFAEPRYVETFNRDPGSFDFTAYLRDLPPPPTHDSRAATVDR